MRSKWIMIYKFIHMINANIAAIINSYVLSKGTEVKEIIFSEVDQYEAESFIQSKLIQAAFATHLHH